MSATTSISQEPEVASDEQELALWREFKKRGSVSAREGLFNRYAVFAVNIARRHHREQSYRDLELAELCQLAYAGLLEALDRFDPEERAPFRAFAAHRISGSIRDGIVRMSEIREQISWRHRIRRERLKLLAAADSEGVETVEALETLAQIAVSLALGFMLEGTGLFLEDGAAADTSQYTAYESLAWKEAVTQLKAELGVLPEREQKILRKHYLEGLNFDQIASLMGVSKGRISQLHRAALLLLRKRMRERGHFRLER